MAWITAPPWRCSAQRCSCLAGPLSRAVGADHPRTWWVENRGPLGNPLCGFFRQAQLCCEGPSEPLTLLQQTGSPPSARRSIVPHWNLPVVGWFVRCLWEAYAVYAGVWGRICAFRLEWIFFASLMSPVCSSKINPLIFFLFTSKQSLHVRWPLLVVSCL